MGTSGQRRQPTVREALPRGISVRAFLADHSPEAREFSRRLRRLRFREGGKVRPSARSSAAWRMPASCATAGRSNRSSTTPGGRASWSIRKARWPPSSGAMSLIRNRRPKRIEKGGIGPTSAESLALSKELAEARLVVRRADDGLRLHAGHGARQRSPRRLRVPRRSGGGAARLRAAKIAGANRSGVARPRRLADGRSVADRGNDS